MKKAAFDGGVGKRHSRPNGIASRAERGRSASVTKRKAENAPQLNRPQRVESEDSNTKCVTSIASNAIVECSQPNDALLAPSSRHDGVGLPNQWDAPGTSSDDGGHVGFLEFVAHSAPAAAELCRSAETNTCTLALRSLVLKPPSTPPPAPIFLLRHLFRGLALTVTFRNRKLLML